MSESTIDMDGIPARYIAHLFIGELVNLATICNDAALGRVGKAIDEAEKSRFTGARATDHAHHLPLWNGQGHVVNGGEVTKPFRQSLDLQHQFFLQKMPVYGGRLNTGWRRFHDVLVNERIAHPRADKRQLKYNQIYKLNIDFPHLICI